MKVSEQWLREWVNPPATLQELADQLTMAGLEVDSIADVAAAFEGIVVGRVLKVVPHPDADKLRLCEVDAGQAEPLKIVCGAANVRESLLVPVALIGARLPGDFRIKKSKLRGEESFGMLCSAKELGLAESSDGLLELPADAPVGMDIRKYLSLDDQVIEIDLTPNRGDCLSIAGVARELGVLSRCDVQAPKIEPLIAQIDDQYPIQVSTPEDCPRYLGRIVKGVDPTSVTPMWMQERLRRGGIRSLGPLIDVTNYVLLELGHPMHAFDLSGLQGAINVRRAQPGETLVLLDGKVVELNIETLIISDDKGPLAMAGIMGGEASSVSDNTRDVLLECAYFAPMAIAGRARQYGLQTDSSHRFERGVNPDGLVDAMERATRLLIDIAGGQAGPIVDLFSEEHLGKAGSILLRASRISRLLGINIPAEEVEEILQRLGMHLSKQGEDWEVLPPSFRFDIAIEADLIEEIGRIHGYNRLPSTDPQGSMLMRACPEGMIGLRRMHQTLIDRGYQEAITYSFVDPADQMLFDPANENIELANPISSEMAVMRSTLWPGLVNAAIHNLNRQHDRVRMFESGLRFVKQGADIKQESCISGVLVGSIDPEQWGEQGRKADFYDIKADVESLLRLTGREAGFKFISQQHPALHPGQSAAIQLEGNNVGWIGAIHPNILNKKGISDALFLFEVLASALGDARVPAFSPLSKYPSVRRDLAIVIDEQITADEVLACIDGVIPELLQEIRIFDVYRGKGVEEGRKSLALGLILQESSRTLNDKDMDAAIERIMSKLQKQFAATLRE